MYFWALQYLKYLLFSSHRKGHGIHSPFVFDFIQNVLNDKTEYPEYKEIENLCRELKSSNDKVLLSSLGARPSKEEKTISHIYRNSSVNKKYGRLLFRMVRYYKPEKVLELGTCLGVSALYMAKANATTNVVTIEGHTPYFNVAQRLFEKASANNIKPINSTFDEALPTLLKEKYDCFFIDGNHTYTGTINYFRQCLNAANLNAILIFDDIYWSADMNRAWKEIVQNSNVPLTIDLFRFGLVFLNTNIYAKMHYRIRF